MASPSSDDLQKLSPEVRIQKLRDLEEGRKRDLAEKQRELEEELQRTRLAVEQEIAAAEVLIKESEKEVVDDAIDAATKVERRRREDVDGLESRVAVAAPVSGAGVQYEQPSLYRMLERDVAELGSLYSNQQWDVDQQRQYRETKDRLERVQTYLLSSEELEELRGVATGALQRLKYRR